MKHFIAVLLSLALLPAVAAEAAPLRDDGISISAPSAILIEKETGTVLYEKDADSMRPPASVTKIMTMLLIAEDIDSGKLSPDDTVTASQRASTFGGSCVFLEEGEQMSVSDMLKCIAVVSANDCAVAMAEHISGSEELFVQRMNKKAESLGLENTHFTNCTGLFDDAEHYTTARDIAIMSRELLKHSFIKEYTTIWMDSIRNGEFMLSNTNKLVYWYLGCTGLKTGYTSSAMYCLSASAEREGVEYIAVIMHGESVDSRNNDARLLLNYAFSSFELVPALPEGCAQTVSIELGEKASVSAVPECGESILLPKAGSGISYEVILPERISAPVAQGDVLGRVVITLGDGSTSEIPLISAESVERAGFAGFLALLTRGLFGM